MSNQINTKASSLEPRSKKLFIIFGFLVVILIIPTIVLAVLYAREKNNNKTMDGTSEWTSGSTASASTTITSTAGTGNDDICLTPYCIKAANYLLESIDESVKPCDDFFRFSCGTWLKNNRIPDDSNVQNAFQILRKQLDNNIVDLLSTTPADDTALLQSVTNARILYNSCINEGMIEVEGIEPVLRIINTELGGWPILQGASWDSSTFNLSNLLLKLRQYNQNIIFRINSDTDETNSSIANILVAQGSLGLPQRRYYENETSVTIAYREYMSKLAEALANDTTKINEDVQNMFEFEKNISKFHWTNAEQSARSNETVRTTVSDLYRVFNTSFDFTNYLRRAYQSGGVTLTGTDLVAVSELDFLTNASSIIDHTSSRILQNYFVWRFIMDRADNMPRSIQGIRDQFYRVFQGTNAEKPRPIKCGAYVNENMGFVVSKLYIENYFDEAARNQSLEMIEGIRKSFIEILNNSTWMESEPKNKAIDKANAIDKQIGYPGYLGSNNNTKLEHDYAEYKFNSSYIQNVLKMLQIKSGENFQLLRKPVDRKAWGPTPPSVVNAFYDPSTNQILFPAGILQMPFFNKDAPKYLNFGGIGMVIGHEITHGFDDSGRQFDKDGNRIPWWTPQTIGIFNVRKQCIIDQYNNFTVSQINININGQQTQGENIADNGGIKAAFYAYRNWVQSNGNMEKKLPGLTNYTSDQLFFMNFAQTWCIKMTDAYARNQVLTGVHSLGQFRVVGPTSNFDQFDRAFDCKPGQGNSRVNKCAVW